ncbi:unnamed protein product [Amoebophrya sp. A25]|nr:unnamed protein product [Amoebophrya sp. A25]|eukprot:GSA25T00016898001.1
MATIEDKYKRRLMTCMTHVLPEFDEAAKTCTLSLSDVKGIQTLIEHDNHENRRKFENLIVEDACFRPYYNCSLDEQREHALRRLQAFCKKDIIKVQDFESNPMNIFMAHDAAALVDGSFATKLTVQFNLWGGTVYRLGSEEHRQFFANKTNSSDVVGCFGLSELGFGNNAVEMETTATYNKEDDTFSIHSPSVLSQKYWITNGACHAHFCVVFAQLIIDGKRQGVHGFITQIRDLKSLQTMPGCRVEDMGTKIGLNGIDNAKILFEQVRIPRSHMLSSYAEVEKGGNYVWKAGAKAPKLRERFLRLADQLLSGRLCISSMMIGATKVVTTISTRYMLTRLGVGPNGKSDTPILDYQLCQHEVFPLIARCYATQFYHNYVKRRYAARTKLGLDPNHDPGQLLREHMELVILCSSVKPVAAWLCDKAVVVCRERVGGVGFLEANGFGGMFAHAGITAEGDARVLCAKVTKELMEILEKGSNTAALNPIIDTAKYQVNWNDLETAVGNDAAKMQAMICEIEKLMANRVKLACDMFKQKLTEFMMKGDKAFRYKIFDANLKEFSDEIQLVAAAYAQWESVRAFNLVIKSAGQDPDLLHATTEKQPKLSAACVCVLGRLALLYAIDVLSEDAINCMNLGVMSPADLQSLRAMKASICKCLRPEIVSVLNGMGIDDRVIWRPIGKDWKNFNKGDNFGEVVDTGRYLTKES